MFINLEGNVTVHETHRDFLRSSGKKQSALDKVHPSVWTEAMREAAAVERQITSLLNHIEKTIRIYR